MPAIYENTLEAVGVLCGLGGVWLTIRKNIWCFPVGIINVLITGYLVFTHSLFADTLQQAVYFVLLVAGWIQWGGQPREGSVAVARTGPRERVVLFIIFLSGSAVMGILLSRYTTASYPWWDSAATVVCFLAQWLIARRKIENWLLWMVANPVYMGLYLLKGLEWYAGLHVIYFSMAVAGWRAWRRTYDLQPHASA